MEKPFRPASEKTNPHHSICNVYEPTVYRALRALMKNMEIRS